MSMRPKGPNISVVVIVCILIGVVVSWVVSWYLLNKIFRSPQESACTSLTTGRCEEIAAAYYAAYAEAKDLGKTFLTLISAVFVASVTFSEKIVDLKTASRTARAAIIICWAFLLLSIMACGTAFVYLALSFNSLKFEDVPPLHQMTTAAIFFGGSGVFFVLGLLMMLLAGVPSLIRHRV